MASNSHSQSGTAGRASTKQAACLNCRKSKMKCHRISQSSVCTKCQKNGTECIVPQYHVGRQKGVKNKHSGLQKAVHQIEEAIRKSQTQGRDSEAALLGVDLEELLKKTREVQSDVQVDSLASDLSPAIPSQRTYISSELIASTGQAKKNPIASNKQSLHRQAETSDLADAENPLQLLAQTSQLFRASAAVKQTLGPTSLSQAMYLNGNPTMAVRSDGINHFFGRFRPKLDVESELDPIEIGLITISEADTLFDFFFQNLAHTRWGVDPDIHTTTFVRSRSAFLLTSICAASALFLPSAAAVSKRLSIHCRKLAQNVIARRYRSVEIVFALMVNVPWMPPGEHWADDESCTYLSVALTIAMDLSLHKIIRSSSQHFKLHFNDRIANADCISARKALDLDGFDDIEEDSSWGRRLLRRRERAWLALFALERGFCLARGRQYTLPVTPLVEICDNWHLSDIADTWDGSIVSVSVLRRELAGLIARVRSICDTHQSVQLDGSSTVQSIKEDIDGFFNRWYSTWPPQIGGQTGFHLPPYVDIIASHTRLSLYTGVINHPSAPVEVKHFFRARALASALNVMRASVQGEGQLKSMPNNTAIMISFAACVALELSTTVDGSRADLAPSVQNLITETAGVLERIGSTPLHRNGASILFAQQIRQVAQRSSSRKVDGIPGEFTSVQTNSATSAPGLPQPPLTQDYAAIHNSDSTPFVALDPMVFSGMSNDEIIEAIDNASLELDLSWVDLPFGDGANLDWLDWTNSL